MKIKMNKGKVVRAVSPATKKSAVRAKVDRVIVLLRGVRGFAARLVERHISSEGTLIRALQDNKGRDLKNGSFAKLDGDVLTGKRQALTELGGYVNGKLRGAKVEVVTEAQFRARARNANVKWNSEDNAVRGFYIGNPNQKSMLAVEAGGHYWQVEQDTNANNKSERGQVLPLKKGDKLAVVK